jgi:hypothetical protein
LGEDLKNLVVDEFQDVAERLLIRNKSIIDLLTKFQDSNARVNREISKAVTQCGCIRIEAKKQQIPNENDFEKIKDFMKTHLEGNLCDNCRDLIEKDIGKHLFYLCSLCNTLDLNIYDIILKELSTLNLLGNYTLR